MRALKSVLLCSMILTSIVANAGPILNERCTEDPLGEIEQVLGRNAWARKCGYLSGSVEVAFNEAGIYAVFTSGKYNGNPNIPVNVNSPCIAGLVRLGACVKSGCYTPNQLVMFANELIPIEQAFTLGTPSVTAVNADANAIRLSFKEQSIESFVAGETQETIYRIFTDNNKKLEVTANHPLVDKDGFIVTAERIRLGDKLLSADGTSAAVTTLETFLYSGKVWNVRPKSTVRKENIIVADGILTGSIRFQNEWAQEAFRLSLRDDMDASILED